MSTATLTDTTSAQTGHTTAPTLPAAFSDLETDYGYGLDLEPVAPGIWFIKRHKTEPNNGQPLHSNALTLYRDLLEAETLTATGASTDNIREFYDQHKTAAKDVCAHLLHHITYDKNTGGASVVLGVTMDMTIDAEGVKELLRYLHQVTDELNTQRSSERPRNIALHLLKAAERLEAWAPDGTTAEGQAAYLFGLYLNVFASRQYMDDYTPIENLDKALFNESDYQELASAGVISEMQFVETEERSGWLLTMFAGADS